MCANFWIKKLEMCNTIRCYQEDEIVEHNYIYYAQEFCVDWIKFRRSNVSYVILIMYNEKLESFKDIPYSDLLK